MVIGEKKPKYNMGDIQAGRVPGLKLLSEKGIKYQSGVPSGDVGIGLNLCQTPRVNDNYIDGLVAMVGQDPEKKSYQ